ncbi:MAG: hypothetical protein AAF235_09155 [Planctomycetota bacterium]
MCVRRLHLGRRGLSLIETVLAITVISVCLGAIAPVLSSSSDGFVTASRYRDEAETGVFAIERMVRLLRESPVDAGGQVTISVATPTRVQFTDGRGFRLSEGTLLMRDASGGEFVLADGVQSMTIGYLARDGVTSTASTPALTQRFTVLLRCGDVELGSVAWARGTLRGAS